MAKSIDLTGQRFGNLIVVEKMPGTQERYCLWRCRCDCGRLITTTAHELKAGKTTSCGCLRGMDAGNFRNITGMKVGRLTVLFPTMKRDQKGSILWHCRCDCGNEQDVSEDGLIHGNYKSCGCLKAEIQQNVKNQLHRLDETCVEWLEKRKHRSDNTRGFRGVYSCNGKFRASIGFKKQRFHIGTYNTFEEAVQARLEAEELIHDGFVKAYYAWQEQGGDGSFIYEVEKADGWFRIHTNI